MATATEPGPSERVTARDILGGFGSFDLGPGSELVRHARQQRRKPLTFALVWTDIGQLIVEAAGVVVPGSGRGRGRSPR